MRPCSWFFCSINFMLVHGNYSIVAICSDWKVCRKNIYSLVPFLYFDVTLKWQQQHSSPSGQNSNVFWLWCGLSFYNRECNYFSFSVMNWILWNHFTFCWILGLLRTVRDAKLSAFWLSICWQGLKSSAAKVALLQAGLARALFLLIVYEWMTK